MGEDFQIHQNVFYPVRKEPNGKIILLRKKKKKFKLEKICITYSTSLAAYFYKRV